MQPRKIIAFALIGICLASFAHGDDWNQFGGPNRNAISQESGLLEEWLEQGPPLAWQTTGIGKGMGGVAVSDGRIFTTGDQDDSSWLFALDESDGTEVWKAEIGRGGNPGFIFQPDGPRATPAIHGDRIYVLSQYGEFVCLTTKGEEIWRTHYVEDLGGVMPKWGYSESPLVDGKQILCVPGGPDATMVAINKDTGNTIWKCQVPAGEFDARYGNDSAAGYSSAIVIDFEGTRQYVQFTSTALVGVAASDGKLLWRYDRPANTHRIPCSTPIYHEGVVFAASAYDAGGGAAKLSRSDSGVSAEEIYFNPIMKNQHGGMILTGGCLYGAAGGTRGGFLVCLDFETGERLWAEREAKKGSLIMAGGRIYLREEDGTIVLIEPNREKFIERGRFRQPDRSPLPAWTHPIVANGKLYIRDQDKLFCYNVQAK